MSKDRPHFPPMPTVITSAPRPSGLRGHLRIAANSVALMRDEVEVDTLKRVVAWLRAEPMKDEDDVRARFTAEERERSALLIEEGWALPNEPFRSRGKP